MDRTTEKWHYGLASHWLHDTLVTSWHDDGKTELLVGNDASPYYTGIIVISGNDLDIHERRAPVKSLISTAEPPPDTAQIAVDLVAFWEGIDSEVKSEVSTQAIINSLINGVSLVLISFMQGVPIGAPYAILWHPRILSPFGSLEVIRAAVDEIICGDLAASFST